MNIREVATQIIGDHAGDIHLRAVECPDEPPPASLTVEAIEALAKDEVFLDRLDRTLSAENDDWDDVYDMILDHVFDWA